MVKTVESLPFGWNRTEVHCMDQHIHHVAEKNWIKSDKQILENGRKIMFWRVTGCGFKDGLYIEIFRWGTTWGIFLKWLYGLVYALFFKASHWLLLVVLPYVPLRYLRGTLRHSIQEKLFLGKGLEWRIFGFSFERIKDTFWEHHSWLKLSSDWKHCFCESELRLCLRKISIIRKLSYIYLGWKLTYSPQESSCSHR